MEKTQAKDLQCQITGKQTSRTGEYERIIGSQGGERQEKSVSTSDSFSKHMLPGLSCWCGSNVEFTLRVEIWVLALPSVLERWVCKGSNTLAVHIVAT